MTDILVTDPSVINAIDAQVMWKQQHADLLLEMKG